MLRQLPVEVSFCGYDRIELDCGGALLDLLRILESFLFVSLDACMKAMLLKHGSFSFLPIILLISFMEVALVLCYSLNYSLYILYVMELLAPFLVRAEALSYFHCL